MPQVKVDPDKVRAFKDAESFYTWLGKYHDKEDEVCFTDRQLEHLLRPRREGDVALWRGGAGANDLLDLLAHGLQGDPQGLERLGSNTFPLGDQAEKDVLGANVVVVEESRLFLSQNHDSPSSIREALKHAGRPSD